MEVEVTTTKIKEMSIKLKSKLLATALFLLVGIFMITSPTIGFVRAADEGGESSGGDDGGGGDSGGSDSGGDSEGGDDGGNNNNDDSGGGSNDNNEGDKQESSNNDDGNNDVSGSKDDVPNKDVKPEIVVSFPGKDDTYVKDTNNEEEKEKAESDVQQQDSAEINDKASDEPTQDEIDKEKAAIEDYIYDEPGKVKLYSTEGVKEPWKIKLIESLNSEAEQKKQQQEQSDQQRHRTEETEQQGNDPCNYFGKNICEGSKDGKTCNEEKFDCLSDTKDKDGNWNYCTTGKCPGDDKPYDKPPVKFECNKWDNSGCWDKDNGRKGDWCKWHKCEHHSHGERPSP